MKQAFFLKRHNTSKQSGFSLVEVMVALGLFAVVMTISVGVLIVLIDANSKAQATAAIINNLTMSLDAMTRDIRTGYAYQCGDTASDLSGASTRDCANGGSGFGFTETGGSLTGGLSNNRIRYSLNTSEGCIQRRLGASSDTGWKCITSPEEITITDLRFYVRGTDTLRAGDETSPTVMIQIEGIAAPGTQYESDFAIQTTVTQRLLDL